MQLNKVIKHTIFFIYLIFLSSCITPYEPVATFEEVQQEREAQIEKYVQNQIKTTADSTGIYESLAYGDLIVYKPAIFHSLDSLYAIKDSLIRINKQREIVETDLELFIDEYRGKAKAQSKDIRYDIEHIYCIRGTQSHQIYSEIFYLDSKDSVISRFKKFHFSIPRKDYSMYKNYLFEMHFTTPRELYISSSERNFIQLFKSKEQELIKTDEHEPFMRHTLQLMNVASSINTVDYVSVTKVIGSTILLEKYEDIELLEIGALIALEDELKQVVGYEIQFTWNKKEDKLPTNIVSTIEFDPYLRLVNFNEQKDK